MLFSWYVFVVLVCLIVLGCCFCWRCFDWLIELVWLLLSFSLVWLVLVYCICDCGLVGVICSLVVLFGCFNTCWGTCCFVYLLIMGWRCCVYCCLGLVACWFVTVLLFWCVISGVLFWLCLNVMHVFLLLYMLLIVALWWWLFYNCLFSGLAVVLCGLLV